MRLLGLGLLVLWCSTAQADWLQYDWTRSSSADGQDLRQMVVDAAGNVYVTGKFDGTIDLGGGPLTSAGGGDIFLAKYDAAGVHQWSRRFGDASSSQVATDMVVDGSGNLIVVGGTNGTLDFGNGVAPLVSFGGFIAGFDSDGLAQWAQRYANAPVQGVALDGSGNICCTGNLIGTTDFGGGPVSRNATINDAFVVKLDASLAYDWSLVIGVPGADEAYLHPPVVDDDGNVLLSAWSVGEVDFGGGSLGGFASYYPKFAKLDPDGNHVWSFETTDYDLVHDMATLSDGSLVVAGENWLGTYSPSGSVSWAHDYASQPHVTSSIVVVNDEIFTTGYLQGDVDLGAGLMSSPDSYDAFIADFDAGGSCQHSQSYRQPVDSQYPMRIAKGSSGQVTIAGEFDNSFDFGAGTVLAAGTQNVFVFSAGIMAVGTDGIVSRPLLSLNVEPNPFNPTTRIQYELDQAGPVTLAVYDARGRLVDRLFENRYHEPGAYDLRYSPRHGSGVLYLRLDGAHGSTTVPVTLLK